MITDINSEDRLVSTTSFTSPPLGSNRVHLGLDLFHRHRFARLGADRIEHLAKFRRSLAPTQFGDKQVADRRGFQQPIGLGLSHQRVWQIQLNRNAHAAHNIAVSARVCQPGTLPVLRSLLPTTPLSFDPNLQALDELPHSSEKDEWRMKNSTQRQGESQASLFGFVW